MTKKEFDRKKIWLNDDLRHIYPEWKTIHFTIQMKICEMVLRDYDVTDGKLDGAFEAAMYLFRRYINGEEKL